MRDQFSEVRELKKCAIGVIRSDFPLRVELALEAKSSKACGETSMSSIDSDSSTQCSCPVVVEL